VVAAAGVAIFDAAIIASVKIIVAAVVAMKWSLFLLG
jgi:hypothetical protein